MRRDPESLNTTAISSSFFDRSLGGESAQARQEEKMLRDLKYRKEKLD